LKSPSGKSIEVIPDLNEHGYLPAGIHVAALDDVVNRFGRGSDQRIAQGQSLRWLVPVCIRGGISRLLINGSFVTDREEPNDVNCVLLQGTSYRSDSAAAMELREGLPFLELKVVNQADFDFFGKILFSSDRDMIEKGLVEIIL
jgi:hypothetical protein